MKIELIFEGIIKCPESELDYLESYIRFMNIFKNLIDKNWNHDEFVRTIAPIVYGI